MVNSQSQILTLTIESKIKIMIQITQSISYLHSKNLIHRDIKPENFIKISDQFKLIDFGLIKQNLNLFKTATVGTLLFQAPEVLDIWFLAYIFYEIVFGQALFNVQIELKFFNLKINIGQIDDKLKDLLKQMLKYHPQERITLNKVMSILVQYSSIKKHNQQQQQFLKFPIQPEIKYSHHKISQIQEIQFLYKFHNQKNRYKTSIINKQNNQKQLKFIIVTCKFKTINFNNEYKIYSIKQMIARRLGLIFFIINVNLTIRKLITNQDKLRTRKQYSNSRLQNENIKYGINFIRNGKKALFQNKLLFGQSKLTGNKLLEFNIQDTYQQQIMNQQTEKQEIYQNQEWQTLVSKNENQRKQTHNQEENNQKSEDRLILDGEKNELQQQNNQDESNKPFEEIKSQIKNLLIQLQSLDLTPTKNKIKQIQNLNQTSQYLMKKYKPEINAPRLQNQLQVLRVRVK
ncbi:unnamed protein product [Paramecium octaurelia]|uniref:Protein kinase domain-containing protein n=1 Tax=Paramecium octaurelia TaxID=43137 RepID=A0A8S1VPP7_PAROT|nr:unnamed protein product [Paramecium octaurelia]